MSLLAEAASNSSSLLGSYQCLDTPWNRFHPIPQHSTPFRHVLLHSIPSKKAPFPSKPLRYPLLHHITLHSTLWLQVTLEEMGQEHQPPTTAPKNSWTGDPRCLKASQPWHHPRKTPGSRTFAQVAT